VPPFATHHLGVAGCILNDKKELLVVKENHKMNDWKLPGGYTEPKEDISKAVLREARTYIKR
jgi:ADP-ribose pyrophosphatase YjhB (NUDIX family)